MVRSGQLIEAAAPEPVGVVAGITVEEDEQAQGTLGSGFLAGDGEDGAAGGDNRGHVGVAVQGGGVEADLKYCHDSSSFLL